jgi:hypothetical protein
LSRFAPPKRASSVLIRAILILVLILVLVLVLVLVLGVTTLIRSIPSLKNPCPSVFICG